MANDDVTQREQCRVKERIQLNLLVPLALGILVLLTTCVVTVHRLHHRHIHDDAQECIGEVSDMFQAVLIKGELAGHIELGEEIEHI